MNEWITISIQRDREIYEGSYRFSGGMMKVKFKDLTEETHLTGHAAAYPTSFAESLLSELVRKFLSR